MNTPTMPHTIKIKFDPAQPGHMTTLVEGVTGPACRDLTKWLRNLGEVVTDLKTGDHYATVEEEVQAGTTVQA
jgi:hypothetical protein